MSNITKYFYAFCQCFQEPYSITIHRSDCWLQLSPHQYKTMLYILTAKVIILEDIKVEKKRFCVNRRGRTNQNCYTPPQHKKSRKNTALYKSRTAAELEVIVLICRRSSYCKERCTSPQQEILSNVESVLFATKIQYLFQKPITAHRFCQQSFLTH